MKIPASINAKYIFSNSKKDLENIFNLLEKGVQFDSLYVELAPADTNKMTIQAGQLETDVEKKLFNLKEKSFSEPIFINDNWFIFKILKRNFPILDKSENWEAEYKRLDKVAKERAERIYYQSFKRVFFEDKKISANGILLKSLAQKVSSLLSAKKGKENTGEKIYLDVNDLVKMESEFGGDTLNMTYIKLDTANIKFKNFIRHFRFESFSTTKTDYQSVGSILNSKTKEFIEQELLASEGFKRGLQNDAEVIQSYEMWRDNYLNQLVQLEFVDSSKVSDEDAYAYYSKNKKGIPQPKQVNIIEVLTDSLEIAERVLNELEAGTDIRQLAILYSKRSSTKNTSGEFGYFPVTLHGEIGRIAGQLEVGQVYGPLKIPEGYSIFKLIDKKDQSVKPPESFEKEKDEIKRELGYSKMQDALNNYIAKLADKFEVKIYDDVLNKIPVTNINAIVYRVLGFGGRITAVPLVAPNTDWVKPWLESKKVLP